MDLHALFWWDVSVIVLVLALPIAAASTFRRLEASVVCGALGGVLAWMACVVWFGITGVVRLDGLLEAAALFTISPAIVGYGVAAALIRSGVRALEDRGAAIRRREGLVRR